MKKHGGFSTDAFLGAAVVEVLLSTDNICLFHQIFEHFKVPREAGGLLRTSTLLMLNLLLLLLYTPPTPLRVYISIHQRR